MQISDPRDSHHASDSRNLGQAGRDPMLWEV
jgi:hypothetical protein